MHVNMFFQVLEFIFNMKVLRVIFLVFYEVVVVATGTRKTLFFPFF